MIFVNVLKGSGFSRRNRTEQLAKLFSTSRHWATTSTLVVCHQGKICYHQAHCMLLSIQWAEFIQTALINFNFFLCTLISTLCRKQWWGLIGLRTSIGCALHMHLPGQMCNVVVFMCGYGHMRHERKTGRKRNRHSLSPASIIWMGTFN